MGLADGNQKMSLITACPACQTQFEVTDEQLQAYAGKVRCGECNHVFDARSFLLEPSVTQVALPEAGESEEAASDAAVYFKVSAEAAQVEHLPDQSLQPDLALEQTGSPTWNINLDDGVDAEPSIPDFLRDVSLADERPAPVQSVASQRVFASLSGILLVAILLQVVYFTRTNLAANYPQTKPWLLAMCQRLHCELNLPHDITQLTIDDADIQEHRERQGVLAFSSVLMNHGTVVQAYPKVELTLTNTADEAVLRKVLQPAQYLPSSVDHNVGLAPQQEQAVRVFLGVDEKLVTGFRVAIAY
jgi:predicted Zn finger-like uncharacterized protein